MKFCFPWNALLVPVHGQLTFHFHTNHEHLNLFRCFNFCFFVLLTFFVNAAVFCKFPQHILVWERSTYCIFIVVQIFFFFFTERRVLQPMQSTLSRWWKAPVFVRQKLKCLGVFFLSIAQWSFLGRHLEAPASFQLLPLSLRCLGFSPAFIYPAALYLGPSSASLSMNCEIRERTGSDWLV